MFNLYINKIVVRENINHDDLHIMSLAKLYLTFIFLFSALFTNNSCTLKYMKLKHTSSEKLNVRNDHIPL